MKKVLKTKREKEYRENFKELKFNKILRANKELLNLVSLITSILTVLVIFYNFIVEKRIDNYKEKWNYFEDIQHKAKDRLLDLNKFTLTLMMEESASTSNSSRKTILNNFKDIVFNIKKDGSQTNEEDGSLIKDWFRHLFIYSYWNMINYPKILMSPDELKLRLLIIDQIINYEQCNIENQLLYYKSFSFISYYFNKKYCMLSKETIEQMKINKVNFFKQTNQINVFLKNIEKSFYKKIRSLKI